MEDWAERVKSSPALLKATELKQLITDSNISDLTNEQQDCIDRAEVVSDAAISRLTNSDPRIINSSALANLGSAFTNAVSHFNSWLQGSGDTYLTSSLQTELDSAITYLVAIAPTQNIPEAQEAVTSLRRSVGRHRAIVDSVIADLEKKGSAADVTIDEKLKSATDGFEKLQTQVGELNDDLTEIKNSSAQVSTEQQTAFTKAEADRSTTFNELVTSKQKQLETSLEEMESAAKKAVETIRVSVKADQDKVAADKTRVEEILGIVGEEALIGDYAKNAKEERNTANLWRRITAGSIAGAIIAAIWFASSVNNTTSWQHVVSKTVIVLSFGGLAGYAGRQSSEHRTAQREAEQMALQLKALKPYLGDIDNKTERDNLLVKIADRLFGHEQMLLTTPKTRSKNDNPLLTSQLLEALLELLKRDKGA